MRLKYLILFSLSGLILCCDQLTKLYAHSFVEPGSSHSLIPGLLSLTYQRNSAFAFGLLSNAPRSLQEVFFIGVPVFALILIVLIFIKLQDDQMLTSVALTSILAGAMGNLLDRVQYGFVIDFLEVPLEGAWRLPPSNIADVAIIAGVGLMFYNTLRQHRALQRGGTG